MADENCDYLIQESDTDKGKLKSVLLMPREKKPAGSLASQGPANSERNSIARVATAAAADADPIPMPVAVQHEGPVGMRVDRRQNIWSINERQADSVTQAD